VVLVGPPLTFQALRHCASSCCWLLGLHGSVEPVWRSERKEGVFPRCFVPVAKRTQNVMSLKQI